MCEASKIKRMVTRAVLFFVVATLCASCCHVKSTEQEARSVEKLQLVNTAMKSLWEDSDFVLIASPTATRRAVGMHDSRYPIDLFECESWLTDFSVHSVFKGDGDRKQFTLFHYKLEQGAFNNPAVLDLASFKIVKPSSVAQPFAVMGSPDYLLYLKVVVPGENVLMTGEKVFFTPVDITLMTEQDFLMNSADFVLTTGQRLSAYSVYQLHSTMFQSWSETYFPRLEPTAFDEK